MQSTKEENMRNNMDRFLSALWAKKEWKEAELAKLAASFHVDLDDDGVVAAMFAEGWKWRDGHIRRD
jgi:hypothetical protein